MDYPKNVPSAGLVNGKFVDEDQVAGTPGSLIPAQWGNAVTEEVLNVITSGGLTPDEDNNSQLVTAINAKIAAAMPASPSDASTTVKGLVELATDAEVQAGADSQRAVTPASLKTAYGLGDSTLVTDLNNVGTGFFYAAPGATNNPGSNIIFGETRASSGTATKMQSCIDISTRVVYKRTYIGGAWSVWTSIIDSATLATETVIGATKIATQAQAIAGLDDTTIVTPKKLRAGFSALFSSNGYIAFPSWLGGLIVQWGVFGTVDTTIGAAEQTVSFPIAFPNNIFTAVSTPRSMQVNPTALIYSSIKALSLTQIQYAATVSGRTYLAIGN